MASIDELIAATFSAAYSKNLHEETKIGKLALMDAAEVVGDTLKVIMPIEPTVKKFKGDKLPFGVEVLNPATVNIPIKDKIGVYFTVSEEKKAQIEGAKDDRTKIQLIAQATNSVTKQQASIIDEMFGEMYTEAGIRIRDTQITLNKDNINTFFALMAANFKRGTRKGHTSWIDGKMIATISPEMEALAVTMENLQFVESRAKVLKDGYIGRVQGWDIIVSNNVANPSDGQYFPLFGQEGKSLVGGTQKKFKLITNIPDDGFNTEYKGQCVYGGGAPRADWLGTQDVKVQLPTFS